MNSSSLLSYVEGSGGGGGGGGGRNEGVGRMNDNKNLKQYKKPSLVCPFIP